MQYIQYIQYTTHIPLVLLACFRHKAVEPANYHTTICTGEMKETTSHIFMRFEKNYTTPIQDQHHSIQGYTAGMGSIYRGILGMGSIYSIYNNIHIIYDTQYVCVCMHERVCMRM